jgi:hypothetical protein
MNDLMAITSVVCLALGTAQTDKLHNQTIVTKCPVIGYTQEVAKPMNFFKVRQDMVRRRSKKVAMEQPVVELPPPIPPPTVQEVTPPRVTQRVIRVATVKAKRKSVRQIPCKKGRSRNNPRHRCERY